MGKVVRAVAVIAVAAAIAYFAPTLGLSALHALGSTAAAGSFAASVATAVVATALSVAATAAYSALSPRPGTTPPPRTAAIAQEWGQAINYGPSMPVDAFGAVHSLLRGPWFPPGFAIGMTRTRGGCLKAAFGPGFFAVYDRFAPIRRGDLFLFDTDDAAGCFPDARRRLSWGGLGKIAAGADPSRSMIAFQCTNPPTGFTTAPERLLWAYRVRAVAPTRWAALRLWWRVVRSPAAFDDRLGLRFLR